MADKEYLEHVDIESLMFCMDCNGDVYAVVRNVPIEQQPNPILAFSLRTAPAMEFLRLLVAAPMLYQALTQQAELLKMLLGDLNRLPVKPHTEALRKMLDNMQTLTKLAQECAIKGIESPLFEAESANRQTN